MARVPRWQLHDLLDLEAVFLADGDDAAIENRDRAIAANIVRPAAGVRVLTGPEKVRLWLEARRAGPDAPVAGSAYLAASRTLAGILIVLGLCSGAGLAAGLLFFHGDRPISVTVFFAATVVWQVVLWLVVAGALVAGRRPLGGMLAGLIGWALTRLGNSGLVADGGRRTDFAAVWGSLRAKRMIYGEVLVWPVAIPAQLFAVALNVGIIAMTLVLVAISNRAFGWETTLAVSPETMLRIVEVISWPWSALPQAHPSLAEIAGSRIALRGEGNYDAVALVAWWPFLVYAVAFYGLLPRVVLLGVSVFLKHRALARLDFRHSDCARLLRRLEPVVVAGDAPPAEPGERAAVTAAVAGPGGEATIILSHELRMPADQMAEILRPIGIEIGESLEAEVDCAEANATVYSRLVGGSRPVAVVLDGSRPPVKAILEFLRQVRHASGPKREMIVVAVDGGGAAFDYDEAWRKRIAELADPYLRVERGVRS